MKKSNLLKGAVAVALGLAAVGCSHEIGGGEADLRAQIIAEYNEMFIKTFGQPASNQNWGFGTSGTRAAATWDGVHSCNWTVTIPTEAEVVKMTGAVDITSNSYNSNDNSAPVYYVPSGKTLDVVGCNMKGGAKFYNFGTIKGLAGNINAADNGSQVVTYYNAGTIDCFYTNSGGRHTIYNTGTLTIGDYANIGDLYNSGTLNLTKAHNPYWPGNNGEGAGIPDAMHIYSTGNVAMPDGGDLKAVCDIHGTLEVTGDVNIQNSTDKHICAIVATGHIQNTDGRLETGYMAAEDIYFEGNHLYLLPGAHVKANTIEFDKAACDVHAAEGSNALVEATVNISFKNDNDFNRTFSGNIYFKVDGSISMIGQTNGGFTDADRILYNSAADYITAHGNPNNHLNAGNATGYPECGPETSWEVGTPDEGNTGEGDGEPEFLGRVFAEDLTVSEATDFDFNDVVFDVYYDSEKGTYVELLAAGGTLPLYIGGNSNTGVEVHAAFGVPTTTMVNTGLATAPVKTIIINSTSKVQPGDIDIYVTKNGVDVKLEAPVGKAASKFCDKKLNWASERQDVDEVMNFTEYVQQKATLMNKSK